MLEGTQSCPGILKGDWAEYAESLYGTPSWANTYGLTTFPFAYFSLPTSLARCAASGSCPPKNTSQPSQLYTIPLMDNGQVVGCGTGGCPVTFPVAAGPPSSTPLACLSATSHCSSAANGEYPFMLFKAAPPATQSGLATAMLERCIQKPSNLTSCDGLPGYMGVAIYDALGKLVGCSATGVTACPPQFPFLVWDANGGLSSCHPRYINDCSHNHGGLFPWSVGRPVLPWISDALVGWLLLLNADTHKLLRGLIPCNLDASKPTNTP